MIVDYNNFAKTFANSRSGMKWEEIYYFFEKIWKFEWYNVLDIGCGSGRLIEHIQDYFDGDFFYTGIDSSSEILKEARKKFPEREFLHQNMKELSCKKKYRFIFLIASFHHLKDNEERFQVLKAIYDQAEPDAKIFMTNWALSSPLNGEKYKNSRIPNSENEFWSSDYNIKIGEFWRYYHNFSLEELKFLAQQTGFKILENRLFNSQRNIITILQK
jgi:SAM-dependent methyltransferase